MVRHWTEAALIEELKKLTIIIDTREQVNLNIVSFLESNKVPYIERHLDVGDYSCGIEDNTFEHSFAVERKANLDELCGNLTAERDRFEREFLRAKARGTKMYLVIENASWGDVMSHNYKSRLTSKSLLASLLSWQARFNITIIMCRQEESARIIYGLLYYAAREELLWGNK